MINKIEENIRDYTKKRNTDLINFDLSEVETNKGSNYSKYSSGKIDINRLLKREDNMYLNISSVKDKVSNLLKRKEGITNYYLEIFKEELNLKKINEEFVIKMFEELIEFQIENKIGLKVFKDIKMLEAKILIDKYKKDRKEGKKASTFYKENVLIRKRLVSNIEIQKKLFETFNISIYKGLEKGIELKEILDSFLIEIEAFDYLENEILNDFLNFLNEKNK